MTGQVNANNFVAGSGMAPYAAAFASVVLTDVQEAAQKASAAMRKFVATSQTESLGMAEKGAEATTAGAALKGGFDGVEAGTNITDIALTGKSQLEGAKLDKEYLGPKGELTKAQNNLTNAQRNTGASVGGHMAPPNQQKIAEAKAHLDNVKMKHTRARDKISENKENNRNLTNTAKGVLPIAGNMLQAGQVATGTLLTAAGKTQEIFTKTMEEATSTIMSTANKAMMNTVVSMR